MRGYWRQEGYMPVPFMVAVRSLSSSAAILLWLGLGRGNASESPDCLKVERNPLLTQVSNRIWPTAVELAQAGKLDTAMRLFREALESASSDSNAWKIHFDYATCLSSASFEVIDRLGVRGPRQSVSSLRIGLICEAASQLDLAERAAIDPRAIAMIRSRHGALLEVWGFPLDAYGWYRASLAADSTSIEALMGLARTTQLLWNPATTEAQ
jgi:hypothetical protein